MSSNPENVLVATRTWDLNGRLLVPHYTRKGYYVAPGGTHYNATSLLAMGGKPTSTMLWERKYLDDRSVAQD